MHVTCFISKPTEAFTSPTLVTFFFRTLTGASYPNLCYLPTCMTAILGSSLQIGDEIAGSSTRDPQGIGKK